MIKTFYQEDIITRLAAIITYGLNEGYSYKSIEEHIVSSSFINGLENNEYNIESKIERIVEETYNVYLNGNKADISYKGLFFAESYFRLFLYLNKSFEYLFLYWSLSLFDEKYGIYHEMDFSNLKNDFETKVKETTLLKKLADDNQIKLIEISKLTGININTIKKYVQSDINIYGASNENIHKLATLFSVKENIFVSNLGVYLDQSIYLFDNSNKDYRNFLGFYFAIFYDSRINEDDYSYDKANNCFISKNGVKIVVLVDSLDNLALSKLNNLMDSNTYVVIIPFGFFGNEDDLDYLKGVNALDVFVLTQEYFYIIKNGKKKEITDTVNRSLIIRAKEKSLSL